MVNNFLKNVVEIFHLLAVRVARCRHCAAPAADATLTTDAAADRQNAALGKIDLHPHKVYKKIFSMCNFLKAQKFAASRDQSQYFSPADLSPRKLLSVRVQNWYVYIPIQLRNHCDRKLCTIVQCFNANTAINIVSQNHLVSATNTNVQSNC